MRPMCMCVYEIVDTGEVCLRRVNLSALEKTAELWRSQQVFGQREIVINRGLNYLRDAFRN